MVKRVAAREARAHFAELTDGVRYTGEPVIVEKQGRPHVAMIRPEDLSDLERLRSWLQGLEFSRMAARAAAEADGPQQSEDEITRAVKDSRDLLYHLRYGGG